ncbi:MAG: neutral zinc metallopeptidase [Thiohalocapsa sp.]|uniref:KPN_02809 family neutral zinc metallopeptidase n=1 Tax=Thiohalocapsa sp. TaxID=2497641 RepID=UPI0025FFA768|nr:neutral zinc metallopeptidase [Thiohalocapsa sp.]MCG6940329.1 neutral zinc metallopeptidase [Thiohalocapsa sp.]
MRWRTGRRSDNVEDRRRVRFGRRGPGTGDGVRMPVGRRTVAGGGIGLLILVVLGLLFGIDPALLVGLTGQMGGGPSVPVSESPAGAMGRAREDELADFVSVVLADTEDTWRDIFAAGDAHYRDPKLVLFTDRVSSACGFTDAAVGPFYCPADERVYIDLAFYDDLRNRFHAPGDFAQAYVIAHEVGHHVQNLLGISDQVTRAQRAAGRADANRLSVMLELQADCLAGVWAHHAQRSRDLLEQGDLREGLNAAAQIGDDRMQRRARGFVVPDSFTHGSSEQRVRWFTRGVQRGDLNDCNTFEAASL